MIGRIAIVVFSGQNPLFLPCLLVSGMWWLGAYLNRFGGVLDQFGALLCGFALGPGMLILLGSMVLAFIASNASPNVRRTAFWVGFLTSIDIVVRGFFNLRLAPFPHWVLPAAFAALFLYLTITSIQDPLRHYRRQRSGLCVNCGYNLTGNVSGVCPECGATLKE